MRNKCIESLKDQLKELDLYLEGSKSILKSEIISGVVKIYLTDKMKHKEQYRAYIEETIRRLEE